MYGPIVTLYTDRSDGTCTQTVVLTSKEYHSYTITRKVTTVVVPGVWVSEVPY